MQLKQVKKAFNKFIKTLFVDSNETNIVKEILILEIDICLFSCSFP